MEPNKIDTKIKEKLVSREIKPSAQAWDRLDAMLSVTENKKKKKKSYSWLYIAASFILFATIGFWFYNQSIPNDNIIIENSIVITKENEKQIDTLKSSNQEIFNSKPIEVVVETTKKQNKNSESVSKQSNNEKLLQVKEQENGIAQNDSKEIISNENEQVKTATNKYITGEMILAAVENRPIEKKELSKKELKSKVRVNTSSLLSSVETELDENHKETTIDKLTRNFKQVKSALANRNYEE